MKTRRKHYLKGNKIKDSQRLKFPRVPRRVPRNDWERAVFAMQVEEWKKRVGRLWLRRLI